MSKLETFLYNQIKDDNDDNYIQYIRFFRSLSESSHLINERNPDSVRVFLWVSMI